MAKTPDGFRYVKVIVSEQCYQRLQELKEENSPATIQSVLAPVVQAFSRGEIRPVFEQQQKPR